MENLCDAVFMGGGVRGVGLAGAVKSFFSAGYRFRRVAGASAGAIVAALLAAGYDGGELEDIMRSLDYLKFKDKDFTDFLGPIDELINLTRDYGVYSADYFESWLEGLLEQKKVRTFADLEYTEDGKRLCCLQVTASDIIGKTLLVLPGDLIRYGLDPRAFGIAKAVRMSMSIPLFYEPYRLTGNNGLEHLIVDGGLFCNYPMMILDDGVSRPEIPVFGFKFTEDASVPPSGQSKHMKLFDYIKQVITAVMDAQYYEYSYTARGDAGRTVNIPVSVNGANVSATDFKLTRQTAASLFNNGFSAAEEFLAAWDFEKWLSLYR